jgi:ribosomal protein S12 methylthiotransferase
VPESVQQQRYERFMECQAAISQQKLHQKVGRVLTVLVDQVDEEGAIARSQADAPEIDGLVYIENGQQLKVGDYAQVRIVEAAEYDLYAELE